MMLRSRQVAVFLVSSWYYLLPIAGFAAAPLSSHNNKSRQVVSLNMADTAAASSVSDEQLYSPKARDAHYQGNVAQYLVDLHDNHATFDFCGGMMFQLVLTDALREHLVQVAQSPQEQQQPVIHPSSQPRMNMIDNYSKSSDADNRRFFHGREIRQVPTAAGGMGMVLQLSLSSTDSNNNNNQDKEGWTSAEIQRYDGWGHDAGREWRKGPQLEEEGFKNFRDKFGSNAFSLHHRFYLHFDSQNRMWLSAEDGCEGTPASKPVPAMSNLFGLL